MQLQVWTRSYQTPSAFFTVCIWLFLFSLPFDLKHIFNTGPTSAAFSKNFSHDIEGFHMGEGNEKVIYFQLWGNSQKPA